jgi:hypothetical protein
MLPASDIEENLVTLCTNCQAQVHREKIFSRFFSQT